MCWRERQLLRAEFDLAGAPIGFSADSTDEESPAAIRREAKRRQREAKEQAELDQILAKIAATGMGSLTSRKSGRFNRPPTAAWRVTSAAFIPDERSDHSRRAGLTPPGAQTSRHTWPQGRAPAPFAVALRSAAAAVPRSEPDGHLRPRVHPCRPQLGGRGGRDPHVVRQHVDHRHQRRGVRDRFAARKPRRDHPDGCRGAPAPRSHDGQHCPAKRRSGHAPAPGPVPLLDRPAIPPPRVLEAHRFQFLHGSLDHLFFNMLGLYFFGGSSRDIWAQSATRRST